MDADRFDTFVRSLDVATPRRTTLGALLGGGLAALLSRFGIEDAEARKNHKKRKRKKKCKGGKKKCGKKCIPKANCCNSADCGVNEKCDGGACVPCLPQGTACTDDAECCTGICDTYTNLCQQVRVYCNNGESCPNGRCCEAFGDKYCLYETATQGACEPEVSCGYLECGNACSDLIDGTYEFCGYYGPAACRESRCCCPKGIPLSDCKTSPTGDLLPRCTD